VTFTAGRLDLDARRRTKSVRMHNKAPIQIPVSEDFDSLHRTAGDPGIPQSLRIDRGSGLKTHQARHIDRDVLDAMSGIVESPLGNPSDERHLTALKSDPERPAGARGLTLATTAGCLAFAARFTVA